MLVPNRHGNSASYRYGFNGMEKDDELKGTGNSYDFGARMYDPRVGRFLSLDPYEKTFPYLSAYNSFANNPIIFIDKDGKYFEIPENLSRAQKIKVQFMLDVLKKVAPKEYELLSKSPVKITVSVGVVPQIPFRPGHVTQGLTIPPILETRSHLKDKDGDYKTRGDFQVTLKEAYHKDETKYEEQFNSTDDVSVFVDISESFANQFVKFGNEGFNVIVADNLEVEGLSKTGGHEFGHVYFGLANPAFSFILDDSMIKGAIGGHVENDQTKETHPNGKMAFLYAMKVEVFQSTAEYKEMVEKFKNDLKEAEKLDKKEAKEKKNEKK